MYPSTAAFVSAALALAGTSSAQTFPTLNNYEFKIDRLNTDCNSQYCHYDCDISAGERIRIPAVGSARCSGKTNGVFSECVIDSQDNKMRVKVDKHNGGSFSVAVEYDFIDKLNQQYTKGYGTTAVKPGYGAKAPCSSVSVIGHPPNTNGSPESGDNTSTDTTGIGSNSTGNTSTGNTSTDNTSTDNSSTDNTSANNSSTGNTSTNNNGTSGNPTNEHTKLQDACTSQRQTCHNQGVATWDFCEGQFKNCQKCANQQADCYTSSPQDHQQCDNTASRCYTGEDTSNGGTGGGSQQNNNNTESTTTGNTGGQNGNNNTETTGNTGGQNGNNNTETTGNTGGQNSQNTTDTTGGTQGESNVCQKYRSTCTSGGGSQQGACTADMQACKECEQNMTDCNNKSNAQGCTNKANTCFSNAGIPKMYYSGGQGGANNTQSTTNGQTSNNNGTESTGSSNTQAQYDICQKYENTCRTTKDSNGNTPNQSTCSSAVAACNKCAQNMITCSQKGSVKQCQTPAFNCFKKAGIPESYYSNANVTQSTQQNGTESNNTQTDNNNSTIPDSANTGSGDTNNNTSTQNPGPGAGQETKKCADLFKACNSAPKADKSKCSDHDKECQICLTAQTKCSNGQGPSKDKCSQTADDCISKAYPLNEDTYKNVTGVDQGQNNSTTQDQGQNNSTTQDQGQNNSTTQDQGQNNSTTQDQGMNNGTTQDQGNNQTETNSTAPTFGDNSNNKPPPDNKPPPKTQPPTSKEDCLAAQAACNKAPGASPSKCNPVLNACQQCVAHLNDCNANARTKEDNDICTKNAMDCNGKYGYPDKY